ncbi:MAG: riboflavin synthase [Alphaproteobacteria bacterium]
MFTGLVRDIGVIRDVVKHDGGDISCVIESKMNLGAAQIGASICCSGVCLTVVEKSKNTFTVDISSETLRTTHCGAWSVMTRINIEPSLKIGDELGGHFVSGHIDTLVSIKEITNAGESKRIVFKMPVGYRKFIAPKGSVVIDGVSLTVNDVSEDEFTVNIIPHTWAHTTLSDCKCGDDVNLEIDILARYVANMMEN